MSYSFSGSEARRAADQIERATGTDIETLGRYALVTGGSLLALSGLKRGGFGGIALAAAGLGLVWQGARQEPLSSGMRWGSRRDHDHVAGVDERHGPVTVSHSVTIGKPRAEIYSFFRDFNNLYRFMEDVERIDVKDDKRSHWYVRAPGGARVEWDAEIHEETENERIAWRSVGDADIHNSGVVEFRDAPGERGTEMRVTLRYEPPFGRLGRGIAKLTGHEPEVQLRSNLRRLKQIMETGTAARTTPDAASSASGASGSTSRPSGTASGAGGSASGAAGTASSGAGGSASSPSGSASGAAGSEVGST